MRAARVRIVAAAAALVLVAAAVAAVVLVRSGSPTPEFIRHAPPGAGYAFDVPSSYELIEYRKPSRPEGSPVSIFRSPRGEFVAATWFGLIAFDAPVTRTTLGRAQARVRASVEAEERRQTANSRGRVTAAPMSPPSSFRVRGLPAQRYFMRRKEVSGERTETELYIVYKGKTPFGLGCRRPVDAPDREGFRRLCRAMLESAALGRAPITG